MFSFGMFPCPMGHPSIQVGKNLFGDPNTKIICPPPYNWIENGYQHLYKCSFVGHPYGLYLISNLMYRFFARPYQKMLFSLFTLDGYCRILNPRKSKPSVMMDIRVFSSDSRSPLFSSHSFSATIVCTIYKEFQRTSFNF